MTTLKLNHVEQHLKKLTTTEEQQQDTKKNKVKLVTKDNVTFEVDHFIAMKIETVQSFITKNAVNDDTIVVPLPNVTSFSLSKVIEYCKEHYRVDEVKNNNSEIKKKHLKEFDERFVEGLSNNELKELLLAAFNLNVKDLTEFLEDTIANVIKHKSVEFIREFFGLVNDFTPEEEAENQRESAWSFQNIDHDY